MCMATFINTFCPIALNVVINKDKLEVYTGAIITLLKNQTHKEIKSLDDDN